MALIQDGFAQVAPAPDDAATVLDARLFAIAPQVTPLFKAGMGKQGAKMASTLGTVSNGLDDLNSVAPVARGLAIRHIACGAEAERYPSAGDAPTHTLGTNLGDGFRSEVDDPLCSACSTSSQVTTEAAAPATSEP